MTHYPISETATAEQPIPLSVRLSAPLNSVSVPVVRLGAWALAAVLGIPAVVVLSRMFTLVVLSLLLGH